MLLVTKVEGPETAETGTVATYKATAFNQPNPSVEDLAKINWEVRCDGVRIARTMSHGPRFDLEFAAHLAGRTIIVMPFANSPTERVSVTTKVSGEEQAIAEPATVALRIEGSSYNARINDGPEFFVGNDVRYQQRRGLMNTVPGRDIYSPDDYREQYGFWADVILPTAICESGGSFHCLNTYDRAAFTFGFFQDAAHEPNENFILLLHRFLLLDEARMYFPDLTLENGRVAQKTDNGTKILETAESTEALRNYLNPDPDAVGEQEAEVAAKFVHWAENAASNRATQVAFTIEQQRLKYGQYAERYDLDGRDDRICIVVADIRHQGRAGSNTIIDALNAADPLDALLKVGEPTYKSRTQTLRREIDRMTAEGILGHHSYSLANRDFVAD